MSNLENAAMKILTTVIGVGIIALFSLLFNFNSRLARIEMQLQTLCPPKRAQIETHE